MSQQLICNIEFFDSWLFLTDRNDVHFLPLQPIKSRLKGASPPFCPITTRGMRSGRGRPAEQLTAVWVWSLTTRSERTSGLYKSERGEWLGTHNNKETEKVLEAFSPGGFRIKWRVRGQGEWASMLALATEPPVTSATCHIYLHCRLHEDCVYTALH